MRALGMFESKTNDDENRNYIVNRSCVFRFGIYPLTSYALEAGPVRLTTYQPQSPTGSMDQSIPSDRSSVGPIDVEVRRIVNMMCNIKPRDDAQNDFMVGLFVYTVR